MEVARAGVRAARVHSRPVRSRSRLAWASLVRCRVGSNAEARRKRSWPGRRAATCNRNGIASGPRIP